MKILLGIIVVISVLLGYLFLVSDNVAEIETSDTDETSEESKKIVLETPVIEHLAPHRHGAHNTVHDKGHHVTVRSNQIMAQEDLWITGFTFTMDNAPFSTLHHVQLTNLDDLSNTCGYNGLPKELLNIGEDTLGSNSLQFKDSHGIFIPKGHRLEMFAMFHNPKPPIGFGGDYYDVAASLELTYEFARESERSVPLEHYHVHLDDDVCTGFHTFAVPGETTDFKREPTGTPADDPAIVQFEQSGEIVYIGGHLHGWEGGKYLELTKNDEIIRRFETAPSDRDDMKWETPHYPDSIPIDSGDVVSVSATYENLGEKTLVGAMGIVSFYFAPDIETSE